MNLKSNEKLSKWWIVGLVLLFLGRLVLGVVLIIDTDIPEMPDTASYIEVATFWDENGLFQSSGTDADLMRTPGYPLLLWLIMQFPIDLVLSSVVIQLAMGGLISLLVFRIVQRNFSSGTAALSAAFVLLSPNLFLWSLTILTDICFTLLLVLSIYQFLRLLDSPTPSKAFWSGLALGAATLIRPIGLLLIPAWVVVVIITSYLDPAWKMRTRLAVMTLIGALVLVLPWIGRNAIVWDQWILSPISTWNLGQYQAAGAVARAEGISLQEARSSYTITRPPVTGDRARYVKIIFDNLDDYLAIHLQGTKTIFIEANQPFFNRLMGERYRGSGVFSALSRLRFSEAWDRYRAIRGNATQFQLFLLNSSAQLGLAMIYLFTFIGLTTIIRSQNPHVQLLARIILVIVILLLLTPGPVGNDRFRIPFEPFMALLAAIGLSNSLNFSTRMMRLRIKAKAIS